MCKNISEDIAIRGMQKVEPDIGAMTEYQIDFFGREIFFINGFAANDPESSETIWHIALDRHHKTKQKIMVINTRYDRPDRSQQIGDMLASCRLADKYIVVGTGGYVLIQKAVKAGIDPSKIINSEGYSVDQIFETIVDVSGSSAMVMGIGNIKGIGLDLIKYFKNRSILN